MPVGRHSVMLMSASLNNVDMQLARSRFNMQERFWVTNESLSIEMLISLAERPVSKQRGQKGQRSWSGVGRRLLEMLGYRNSSDAVEESLKPPLIFLHGSYHSAWCYAENFMPFFTAL
eukprot:gene38555-46864_t